jgi:hypothetical protein
VKIDREIEEVLVAEFPMEFLSGLIFRNVVLLVIPVDLARIITIKHPAWRAAYRIEGEVRLGFTYSTKEVMYERNSDDNN